MSLYGTYVLKTDDININENDRKKNGGCYLSTVSVCIIGLAFVASLIVVGLVVYFAVKKEPCSQERNGGGNNVSPSYQNTYRNFWYKFDQCQTWASGGRLSNHFEKTLVSTSWLSDKLGSTSESTEDLRILDTSTSDSTEGEILYRQEHITNALLFDHFRCVNSSKLFPRNLPDQVCFEEYLQSLGIHGNTHVIVYDRYKRRPSGRTWWILRLHGHEKVSILDGGFQKWKSDGYSTTSVIPTVQASNFQIDFNPILIRDFESMSLNYDYNIEQVVDARQEAYFTGELTEEGLLPGHIPGSVSVPFEEMFNADKTFKSAHELRLVFENAGIDLEKPVVATCETAMRATGTAVAFHILGKVVAVYHGSWTEWSQRASADRIAIGK